MADQERRPRSGVEAKVEDWLNQQGYPLEYKTYNALRKHFTHSGLGAYVPTEDKIFREIDVFAQKKVVPDPRSGGFIARVQIECRHSREKPWVLLCGNPDLTLSPLEWGQTPRTGALEQIPDMSEEQVEELRGTFHFAEGHYLAHNIVQAFARTETDNRDRAYDALQKVANGAWDCARWWDSLDATLYAMIFPALVVEGPLLAASYSPLAQRVVAREISFGRVWWRGCRSGTNVDVVQSSALDEYAEQVSGSLTTILRVLQELYGTSSRCG